MNITRKTSKKGLVEYIKENMGKVMKNKKMKILADQITYTMNKFKEKSTSVDKDTLFNLVTDIRVQLGEQVDIFDLVKENEPLPVENSLKAIKGGKAKKTTEIKMKEVSVDALVDNIFDTVKVEQEEVVEVKPKGSKKLPKKKNSKKTITEKVKESAKALETKKAPTKKVEEPKAVKKLVKIKATVNKKQKELADSFPEEFEIDGMGKAKVIKGTLTMQDLYKKVSDGSRLVFAMYWSKRLLKQHDYDLYQINSEEFKEFPNDLDVTQLMHICDEYKVAYVMSTYSQVMYTILPKNLEYEDGMRFSNGIEYNIYEIID